MVEDSISLTEDDTTIEETLEQNGLAAEILRSTFSEKELETAVRMERALARHDLSPAQVDQLRTPPRSSEH